MPFSELPTPKTPQKFVFRTSFLQDYTKKNSTKIFGEKSKKFIFLQTDSTKKKFFFVDFRPFAPADWHLTQTLRPKLTAQI